MDTIQIVEIIFGAIAAFCFLMAARTNFRKKEKTRGITLLIIAFIWIALVIYNFFL